MILIIDNYDSFVFNIARYVEELGQSVQVKRNDCLDVEEIRAHAATGLILSPGPCTPNEAGISLEAVRRLSGKMPILGICLGHQCIGQAFGAEIVRARTPMHGRATTLHHDGSGVFAGLPPHFSVGLYHSLAVSSVDNSEQVACCAWSEDGEVMAIRHVEHPTFGVQFHPESILTEHGHALLAAFLQRTVA